MRWLRKLHLRVRSLFDRSQVERDLDDELRDYLEREIDRQITAGLPPEEAKYAAISSLHGAERLKEECRDARGIGWLEDTLNDLRFAARTLRKSPGFAAVAVLTLALGAGANALMFTVIDSVLLRPLPYPDSQQLVYINSIPADHNPGSTSVPNFLDLRKQSRSFSGIAAYEEKSASLRLPRNEAIHSSGAVATANLFDVLRVPPMLGHSFSYGQDQAGKPCSVILSAEFWREHLSGDPGALGRNLTVDGKACSISGVMPDGFMFPSRDTDFWIPLQPSPDAMNRGANFLSVIARLKPGATLAEAQTELKIIASRLERAYPDDDKGFEFGAQKYQDRITGDMKPALIALLCAVAVLLLIACANIANLQLARALGRKREIAIRAALGAGRMRVTRQLLTENLLLALLGTGAGLVLAAGSLGLLRHLAADAIPRVQEIDLRPEICLAMLLVASLCALLFGLAPVWQAVRQDIETALRESTTSVAGGHNQQIRNVLVVAQLSLAIVLLAGSGLLLRTIYHLLHTDSGFVAEHVLTVQTAVSGTEPEDRNLATTVYGPELDQIAELPGVKAAGFITFLPLSNGSASATFLIKGRPDHGPGSQPHALLNAASEDFFSALQVPLLKGRFFARTDTLGQPRVAIVNGALARRYFAGADPIGKQIAFDDSDFKTNPITIVGVVGNIRQVGLAKPPDPQLYLAFRQVPPATLWSQFLLKQIMTYAVRVSNGDPAAVSKAVRQAIERVDPGQTVFHVATMNEIVSASVKSRRLAALLLSVFAGLALVVAVAGLYGVLSYMVTQKKRDIALRMALGAGQKEVVRMVVTHALVLYAVGLAMGLAGVIWCGHLLSSMLTGVQPWDPVALSITTIALLFVSFFAAWFPARRAASIDPYQALRAE